MTEERKSLKEIYEHRLKKLELVRKLFGNPYPSRTYRTHRIADAKDQFEALMNSGEKVTLAGRVMSIRGQGAIVFANIDDGSGSIQVVLKKGDTPENVLDIFSKVVDIGDFIETSGTLFVTRRGENSLLVGDFRVLTKSLLPLPDKREGLKDYELRMRKRYLDILMNPELKEMFIRKAKFWEATRSFLKDHGFIEVETPTLEVIPSGANARPFLTYHNDFEIEVHLRISIGELWQKRLMAAGFEKTFEIGRAYRNEGSSPNHLQEFTNMEFYWAYSDYREGMEFVRNMYLHIVNEIYGRTKFKSRGFEFDLADEWEKLDYVETVKKMTGVDILNDDISDMITRAKELGIELDEGASQSRDRISDSLWKYCRKSIAGPAFLINHPKFVSPLSKSLEENPLLTERFQPIIAGTEVGNGFSELNDPIDQKERFLEQQKFREGGDDEAMQADWDFVEMLEHGMPPTFGFGFGERMFAILEDKTLRETTLFPLVKPKHGADN